MCSETNSPSNNQSTADDWPIKDLWEKYEDIAMHFNDLIIRLRTQALGAVAALSALVGIVGKSSTDSQVSWELAAFVFAFLAVFWIAIWIIDFCYYNRLLIGAVDALLELEKKSKETTRTSSIDMSTKIAEAVAGRRHRKLKIKDPVALNAGRWAFYIIVFIALSTGCYFSWMEHHNRVESAKYEAQGEVLSSSQIKNLVIHTTLKDGYLSGKIFNTNADIKVIQVTFEVVPRDKAIALDKLTPHLFNVTVSVPPATMSKEFHVETGTINSDSHTLQIAKAFGVKLDK